jgi:hypothetical protein
MELEAKMHSINELRLQERLTSIATIGPCRLPRHGRRGSRVTIFPSRKNSAPLMCESLLEAAFCLELERRTDIVCYRIHPYTLAFEKARIRYTPDFEVTFASGAQQLIEVKNDQSFQCQKTRARLFRIMELLAEHDCLLECLPMHQFYEATRTANLSYLYHRGYSSYGHTDSAIRRYVAQQAKPISLRQLLQTPFEPADVAHALFYRIINCNIRAPITTATKIWFSAPPAASYFSTRSQDNLPS